MSREKSAVTLLEQVDADICGILFNGLPPKSKDCNYRLQQYWQEYKQQMGKQFEKPGGLYENMFCRIVGRPL